MKRLNDFDLLLIKWARAELGNPFVWGSTNCVSLALRALDVQCGSDLHARYKKNMTTERRAIAWVLRNGLSGLIEQFIAEGCIEIQKKFMQPGDLCFVEMPDNIGASIYLGRDFLSSTASCGVLRLDEKDLSPPSIVIGVR